MNTAATGSLPERTPETGPTAGEARATASGESRPRAAALIVTALEEMDAMAAALAEGLALTVEIASSRAAALRLLQRRAYAVVVLDQTLAEADAEGADLVWKYAGLAIPLQINFALAGCARLEREIRAALARRQREQQLAALAATAELDAELKNAVTGFLLESRLALEEKDLPAGIECRLRTLAGIANRMRERLSGAGLVGGGATPESPTNTQVPLRTAGR
jgi:CheY-like chemotaxis protein